MVRAAWESRHEGGPPLAGRHADGEVLPKIHQRYLTLYTTIEDKVSQMLRQYGELCQDALQTIGEKADGDRMDLRLGLSTEIQRGITVITDALKARKPRDILHAYRTTKRPPSRTFDMMFRELEPKIQKKYLDTVADSYEILMMLAEKAAAAAMAVSREDARPAEPGQRRLPAHRGVAWQGAAGVRM